VKLSQDSSSPEQALDRARTVKTTYALRGSDFGRLDRQGVPPPVLDHLQQSFVNDVDLMTRYWAQGEWLGGCDACYPQPLDLATLEAGGNGMAPYTGFRYYSFARPPGVPEWVPATPGTFRTPMLTVPEVAEMARRGMPEQELVDRVYHSNLDGLIGTGGWKGVSTHMEAGLKGSQLAALSREGVTDPVLDALQAKFLAQWVEFARLRYQSLGKGSSVQH
jgi:hypothetical protein